MSRLATLPSPLFAIVLAAAGCGKKADAPPAGTGSGSAMVGSGSGIADGSGSAAATGSGSGEVGPDDSGTPDGSAAPPADGSGATPATPAADVKAPIPARKLGAIIDREAQKSAQAVARALILDDVDAFMAVVGSGALTVAGKAMSAAEAKAAAGTSVRTWLGWGCAGEPTGCAWEVALDGITMTVAATGAPTLTFGLTAEGTWPLTGVAAR